MQKNSKMITIGLMAVCIAVLCLSIVLVISSKKGKDDIQQEETSDAYSDTIVTDKKLDSDENSISESNVADTPISVVGSHIEDGIGGNVQLTGVSTHGLSWYPEYVNEEAFRQLHEQWGVNCIRLAMYTAEYNGYCTGDEANRTRLKNLVDDGVRYATQNNMYVIIDWHILSDGNPNTYLSQSKDFFAEMSSKYASQSNVLYEICNEPNGGTTWSQIKEYANEVIPVIRENDSDAIIIVGTPNWSQYIEEAADDPLPYDNIMYSLHFYAATHKDSLRNALESAAAKGLPVFVSEFGICDASGSGGIDEESADTWIRLLNRLNISYVAWNLSNKNETSAIIDSSCTKTSGWSYEELSASGKWLFNMLNSGSEYTAWETDSQTDDSEAEKNNSDTDMTQSSVKNADDTQQSNTIHNNEQQNDTQSQNSPSPENQGADKSNEQTGNTEVQAISHSVNDSYDMQLRTSWNSNGENYYLYDLTIYNTSDKAVDSWTIYIDFEKNMVLSDSWCGVYNMNGSSLSISSMDYNGAIPAGGSISNVGFIVHD